MKVEFIRNVFPGDAVPEDGTKCLGIFNGKATVIGQLCRIERLYFVRSRTNKYRPTKYDIVMGRVIYTSADYYKVDLGCCTGYLPCLAFANATKRNRPELQRGDVVACAVTRVEGGSPLLCCRQDGLGKVDEVFPVESWKIRLFYFSDWLLKVGAEHSFKIVLGMNGFVWIDGDAETKREVLRRIKEFR